MTASDVACTVKEEQGKMNVDSLQCMTLPMQNNKAGKETLLPAGRPQLLIRQAFPCCLWQLAPGSIRGHSQELADTGLLLESSRNTLLTSDRVREAEVCHWQPKCSLDLCNGTWELCSSPKRLFESCSATWCEMHLVSSDHHLLQKRNAVTVAFH